MRHDDVHFLSAYPTPSLPLKLDFSFLDCSSPITFPTTCSFCRRSCGRYLAFQSYVGAYSAFALAASTTFFNCPPCPSPFERASLALGLFPLCHLLLSYFVVLLRLAPTAIEAKLLPCARPRTGIQLSHNPFFCPPPPLHWLGDLLSPRQRAGPLFRSVPFPSLDNGPLPDTLGATFLRRYPFFSGF